jgi:hypothetical protein
VGVREQFAGHASASRDAIGLIEVGAIDLIVSRAYLGGACQLCDTESAPESGTFRPLQRLSTKISHWNFQFQ